MSAVLPVEGLGIRSSGIDLNDERKTKKSNEDFWLFPEKNVAYLVHTNIIICLKIYLTHKCHIRDIAMTLGQSPSGIQNATKM